MPELLKRAAALDSTVRPMAYLEPNKGGIVSLGLARLAAALKVSLQPAALHTCRHCSSALVVLHVGCVSETLSLLSGSAQ